MYIRRGEQVWKVGNHIRTCSRHLTVAQNKNRIVLIRIHLTTNDTRMYYAKFRKCS